MARHSYTCFVVARCRAFAGAVGAVTAPVVLIAIVVGGACAHEPPVAVASPEVARRPTPVRRQEATVAAAGTPAPVQPTSSSGGTAIFFDFDSAVLRDDAQPELQRVAQEMRARHEVKLRVEGNCDQLGTIEYNLALGEHRAVAARQYLVRLGIQKDRIATVSYGAERPKFRGANEEERARNRRDDFVLP